MNTDLKKNNIGRKLFVAVRGAWLPYKTEVSIRIQTGCVLAAIVLGIYMNISIMDWLWIVIAGALLLITETLNTAIEKLVDLVSPDYHETAGIVKDLGAGAVFMAGLTSGIIALLIFIPYF